MYSSSFLKWTCGENNLRSERTILVLYEILLYFVKYYFSTERFTPRIEIVSYFNCLVRVLGGRQWSR